MKIRFRVSIAGRHFSVFPGQVVDWPESEARKWLIGNRAEIVEDEPVPPPNAPTAPETADDGVLDATDCPDEEASVEPERETASLRTRRLSGKRWKADS